MSKFKENAAQKKDILDISNDDFESPVVFKKFKPSNNSCQTRRIKHKKPCNKKQLTLHQVYDENFRYSDMNSEHLQLALALSRSTTEMVNHNSIEEEFPFTSQNEGKKKTLLEFGFKINKPKMNVDNKILKREPPKIKKKSKFRFVTPILMMRTEEERESLIQSKLSSIFGLNIIHSADYKNSIPEVSSEELNRIRCQDCSIFYLNGKGDSLEEKDFIVPQLNIIGTRTRTGVLLKDWKQIALRDHSPTRSVEMPYMFGQTDILDSKIENYIIRSKFSTPGNNREKDQLSNNDSNVVNNRSNFNLETLESNESLENSKSPSNLELSVGYEYEAVSPDLFDNDISLSNNNASQIKKNLNSIFSQEETYGNIAENSTNELICSSNEKHFSNEEWDLNLEKKIHQENGIVFFLEDIESSRNECEKNNENVLGQNIKVKTKRNCSRSYNKMKTKLENNDNSSKETILNVDENKQYNLLNSKDELKGLYGKNTSILVSNADTIILTSDEEFPTLEVALPKPFSERCHGGDSCDSFYSCSKIDRTSLENIVNFRASDEKNFNENDSSEKCIYPHSNGETSNIFSASSEDHMTAKSIDYDFSESYKLSERISSDSHNEKIVHSPKTNIVNETNRGSSDEIILSSDEEYFYEEENKNLSDILKLGRLHQKYFSNSTKSTADNSNRKHMNVNKSIFLENQRILSDSVNCSNSVKIEGMSEETEYCNGGSPRTPVRNMFENIIPLSSDDEICNADIRESKNELSSDNLKFEKATDRFSDNLNPDEECIERKSSREHLSVIHKESQKKLSDILSDSVLDHVFDKHSSCLEKNSLINPVTEAKEKYNSFDSDVEMKHFWYEESISNFDQSNKQKHANESKSSSSNNSFFTGVDSEITSERDFFHMNFRNENISKVNLENAPDQKLRKTPNTPLRRCASFNHDETPTKNINFGRHKSESNITPNRKISIKTENITPMLDYNALSTPDIVQELDKFGLKPLKRKRGINLLKHIYETTHPIMESHQSAVDEIPNVKRKKCHVENTDNLGIVGSHMKVWSGTILERDAILERKRSSKISTCQIPLQIVWHNFLSEHPDILQNILLYEPLQIEVIYKMLKELGYKFHIQDLIAFLDQKCITIRFAKGNQGKVG